PKAGIEPGPDVVLRRRVPRITTEGDSSGTAPDSARATVAPPLPSVVALSAPYPNPTRDAISLALELPRATGVEMSVIDLQGRVVWSDATRPFAAGRWVIGWSGRAADGRATPAGAYFVRVRTGDTQWVRRVTVVR
ncbi:MAG TPA: T9SS type A sorting domain-containing protein, partial [Dongiaceae bacterium]|nr:T9SS type A sorting domain-containing protein [Dongiaceae bacterium]